MVFVGHWLVCGVLLNSCLTPQIIYKRHLVFNNVGIISCSQADVRSNRIKKNDCKYFKMHIHCRILQK